MKKIRNGKLYDTDTAKCIGSYQYLGESDFHYVYEELYRKKTGEYFLYGEGGPASRLACNEGYGYCAGEGIRPLTDEQAREWAEEHMDADEYLKYFNAEE